MHFFAKMFGRLENIPVLCTIKLKQTHITNISNTFYIMEKLATKRQLWALFCITKNDYRNANLTMSQASELIKKYGNKQQPKAQTQKVDKLEEEYLAYMKKQCQSWIAIARKALNIQSVVEDDPRFTDPKKCKKYNFFGYGCGISIINFDKRSKVGKRIMELRAKHRHTIEQMFLNGFTKTEQRYYEKLGCPLLALFTQDIRISRDYVQSIASFMQMHNVKNVELRTFVD